MRLLPASAHRRMPWKNGGGETMEIAVYPPEASLADFGWRVSMARVATDGPFSIFPGIDRTLGVLSGEGLDLAIEGHGRHRLTAASDPLAFPADAPTEARLTDGPITDLNVMTRRPEFTQTMRRLRTAPTAPFEARGRWIILCAARPSSLVVDGRPIVLGALDALVLQETATIAGTGSRCDLSIVEISSSK